MFPYVPLNQSIDTHEDCGSWDDLGWSRMIEFPHFTGNHRIQHGSHHGKIGRLWIPHWTNPRTTTYYDHLQQSFLISMFKHSMPEINAMSFLSWSGLKYWYLKLGAWDMDFVLETLEKYNLSVVYLDPLAWRGRLYDVERRKCFGMYRGPTQATSYPILDPRCYEHWEARKTMKNCGFIKTYTLVSQNLPLTQNMNHDPTMTALHNARKLCFKQMVLELHPEVPGTCCCCGESMSKKDYSMFEAERIRKDENWDFHVVFAGFFCQPQVLSAHGVTQLRAFWWNLVSRRSWMSATSPMEPMGLESEESVLVKRVQDILLQRPVAPPIEMDLRLVLGPSVTQEEHHLLKG